MCLCFHASPIFSIAHYVIVPPKRKRILKGPGPWKSLSFHPCKVRLWLHIPPPLLWSSFSGSSFRLVLVLRHHPGWVVLQDSSAPSYCLMNKNFPTAQAKSFLMVLCNSLKLWCMWRKAVGKPLLWCLKKEPYRLDTISFFLLEQKVKC